jgi:hypothetical protein
MGPMARAVVHQPQNGMVTQKTAHRHFTVTEMNFPETNFSGFNSKENCIEFISH